MMWPLPVYEGSDADRELGRLGLHPNGQDELAEVLRAAYAVASDTTPFDSPADEGMTWWLRTVRSLRRTLADKWGWAAENDGTYCLAVRPDGQVAIQVSSGNEHTGLRDRIPSCQNAKGAQTARSIDLNQAVMHDPQTGAPLAPLPRPRPRQTWLLLYYFDPLAEEIRAELSLPIHLGLEDRIDGWAQRIILRPMPLVPVTAEDTGPDPVFDVEVRRRA